MEIKSVKATPVNFTYREPERWSQGIRSGITAIVIEVTTRDGLVGWGESVPSPHPEVTLSAIKALTPLLIDKDPRRITQRWQDIQSRGGWGAFPRAGNAALAGIEIACWDLLGKSLNAPVHALLGGAVRDKIEFMGFVPYHPDVDRVEAEARSMAEEGYGTLYIKGGFGERNDLESVRALRRGGGPNVRLRIDPNEAWPPDVAIRMIQSLRDLDLQYIEQPTRMDRIEDMGRLRRRSPIPIAANQSSWLNHHVLDIIIAGAADIIMTDPWQAGGLRGFHQAATLCETAGLPLVYHSFAPLSIGTRAAMQVLASGPACGYAHQTYHGMLEQDVLSNPVKHPGGWEPVDFNAPGIGVEVDSDLLAEAHRRYLNEGYLSPYGG